MSSTPAARPDLFVEEVDGEIIVYDGTRKTAHALNASAGAVLLLCDGKSTIHDLAGAIAASVGAPTSDLLDQVQEILDAFSAKGLLVGDSPV